MVNPLTLLQSENSTGLTRPEDVAVATAGASYPALKPYEGNTSSRVLEDRTPIVPLNNRTTSSAPLPHENFSDMKPLDNVRENQPGWKSAGTGLTPAEKAAIAAEVGGGALQDQLALRGHPLLQIHHRCSL